MSIPASRKRTEMACSTCRQRKIKCESNKPHPCKNCQEKGKACEYMSVADDPKAATPSRSSPPAQSFATSSSNSPAYSPPPGTSVHHSRTYSNGSTPQRLSQTSSSRSYGQSSWPSSTQYPPYDRGHIQSPSLHDAAYGSQPSYPYLDAAQTTGYQTGNGYSSRPQGMVANGLPMPVSESFGTSTAPPNWVSQPSGMHFPGGTVPSTSYPYHAQQQPQYSSTSQNNPVQYQGYPQEQEGYHSSAQDNLAQYSSHSGPYQQR